MMRFAGLVFGALLVSSTVADAQGRGRGRLPESTLVRPRGGGRGRGMDQLVPGPQQQALARQIRERFAGLVRRELKLNDEQARHLQQSEDRFDVQRRALGRDERDARLSLQAALEDTTTTPDQTKIEQYMNRLVQSQHKRADQLEAEQKELATFLTPVQRAKYLALHEQLNRRVQQMRQEPGGGRRGVPPPPPEQ